MGFHLMAGTLNQAALARDHAGRAAAAWLLAAVAFVGWLVAPVVDDELLRAEIGYLGAAALLCATAPDRVPPGRVSVGWTWPTRSSTIPSTPAT